MNPLIKLRDWLKKPVSIPSLPNISFKKKPLVVPKDWIGNARIKQACEFCVKTSVSEREFRARFNEALRVDKATDNWADKATRFNYLGLILEGRINIGS